MKKRILAILMLTLVVVSIFTACGKKGPITQEQAQKIALEHAGLTQKDASDVHVHVTSDNGLPCYSVHITTVDGDFSVIINASTGEVVK